MLLKNNNKAQVANFIIISIEMGIIIYNILYHYSNARIIILHNPFAYAMGAASRKVCEIISPSGRNRNRQPIREEEKRADLPIFLGVTNVEIGVN
jgi:hypothetical protein